MTASPLKTAVIGLCHLHPRGYMQLIAQIPELKVIAAADANAAVRGAFCRDYGVTGYESTEALLKDERPDLALIFLPHCDCPDAAELCAARGVHLVVEKPMAADSAGAQRITIAARKAGVKITTPYLWRYHPVAIEMKRLVDEGVIGQVISCEGRCAAGRLDRYIKGNAGWMLQRARSGGGPMYNLGVHWIDLFSWILKSRASEVIGRNIKVNEEYDIEDNSLALITFGINTTVALDISYTVPDSYPYGRDLYLAVKGRQGVTQWTPSFEGTEEDLFVCSDMAEFAGAPRRTFHFELEQAKGYCGILGLNYLRDVVRCIEDDTPEPIMGEDGVKVLKVVEAVYESVETERVAKVKW